MSILDDLLWWVLRIPPKTVRRYRKKCTVRWASNAPAPWPRTAFTPIPLIKCADWKTDGLTQYYIAGSLGIDISLQGLDLEMLKEKPLVYLSELGILHISFLVRDGARKVPVLVYGQASVEAAAHFAAATKLLLERDQPAPVYYAPELLPATDREGPLEPLTPSDLDRCDGEVPPGHYAMWWASKDQPNWQKSPTTENITRVYRALGGIECTALRRFCGYPNQGAALPESLRVTRCKGPENIKLLVSASQEKGIRLHFHTQFTPVWYRDAFWALFADMAERIREDLIQNGFPVEIGQVSQPLFWWQMTLKMLEEAERAGDPIQQIGVVPVEN